MAFTRNQKITIAVAIIGASGAIIAAIIGKLGAERPSASEYTGVVTDGSQKPLQNAKVTLLTQGPPSVAYTDVNGVYRIKLDHVSASSEMKIKVDADGFEPYSQNLADSSKTRIEEIRLKALKIINDRGLVDFTREVDSTRLRCLSDGRKNDEVIYTDVIKFLESPPPSRYHRKFFYDSTKGAALLVRDLVTTKSVEPTAIAGGKQTYGSITVQVDRSAKEARIEWIYRNVHSESKEGVGLTAAAETSSDTKEWYAIHDLKVTYRLPPGIKLTQRAFDGGAELDKKCLRNPDGFTCLNLDSGAAVRETWTWNVWDNCDMR